MRIQHLNFNHIISYFISRLQVGLLRKLRFIKLIKTDIIIRLLKIFYQQGVIRAFKINNNDVAVYFKYLMVNHLLNYVVFHVQVSVVIEH